MNRLTSASPARQRPGRGQQPVSAKANEPDCSSSRPNVPGAARRRTTTATAPKLAPIRHRADGVADQRELALEVRHELAR